MSHLFPKETNTSALSAVLALHAPAVETFLKATRNFDARRASNMQLINKLCAEYWLNESLKGSHLPV
jgi:hypothetical protein